MSRLAPFESSIAERYHEETKYSEAGLRREADERRELDWSRQPVPFKEVEAPRILLPHEGLPVQRAGAEPVAGAGCVAGTGLDVARLARVLFHTNGCTRIVRDLAGRVHHFRASPSAGAMYPTELYAAVRGVAGLASGVYVYQLLDHSLQLVQLGDPVEALTAACFGHPAAAAASATLLLTGVWYRSSWRYRERGYRRTLLDTGHVLGNACLAARHEGLAPVSIACFRDELVENLLGLDPVVEGPLVIVPLLDTEDAAAQVAVPTRRSPTTEWRRAVGRVGERVPQDAPERLIAALHLATRMDSGAEALTAPPQQALHDAKALRIAAGEEPTEWGEDVPIVETIVERRSARFFRTDPIPRAALFRVLAFATPRPHEGLFIPELLRTYIVSNNIVGLPPGSYLYDPGPRQLTELSRAQLAAPMLHLGLGQHIFENAGAIVVHTVDLTRAVERYGDRVYRLLGLDAGHMGERLNLAAVREGLGVSGCGGYYDDEMNRVLAIPESQAVVYLTSLGTPGEIA